MNIVCLCPTYGRRPELLENTIACFDRQDYPADKRRLFLFDDLGTLDGVVIEDLRDGPTGMPIVSQHDRCLSIADKYSAMLARIDFPFDAVAVWDDDDVYFPWHLSAHVEALRGNDWSKPSHVWTAAAQPPILESSAGRFHGSIAIRRECLERVGGWVQTRRADFDQQMMARLDANGRCGDPCDFSPPSYVYRWQTTSAGHCSWLMSAPANEDWYDRYQPDHPEPIAVLSTAVRPRHAGAPRRAGGVERPSGCARPSPEDEHPHDVEQQDEVDQPGGDLLTERHGEGRQGPRQRPT